jgi:hypothetical protein
MMLHAKETSIVAMDLEFADMANGSGCAANTKACNPTAPQDPHRIPTGSARMFEGAMPAVLGAALPCAVACPTVANNRGISQLVGKKLTVSQED